MQGGERYMVSVARGDGSFEVVYFTSKHVAETARNREVRDGARRVTVFEDGHELEALTYRRTVAS